MRALPHSSALALARKEQQEVADKADEALKTQQDRRRATLDHIRKPLRMLGSIPPGI